MNKPGAVCGAGLYCNDARVLIPVILWELRYIFYCSTQVDSIITFFNYFSNELFLIKFQHHTSLALPHTRHQIDDTNWAEDFCKPVRNFDWSCRNQNLIQGSPYKATVTFANQINRSDISISIYTSDFSKKKLLDRSYI